MKAAFLTCFLLLAGMLFLAPGRAFGAVAISPISDVAISEDTSAGPIQFGITGFQSRAPAVSGRSSDTRLIPDDAIVIGGSGGSRTVTVTPLPNASGSATITLTVTDLAGTDTETFVVTVRAVNDPPGVSKFADAAIDEDKVYGPIAFTVDDLESPVTRLTVTTSTTNPNLIPPGNIVVDGTGADRTLTVTPVANLSGSSVIGVFVSDGDLTTSVRFTLTVRAVNDPPVFSDLPDTTIDEDTATGTLTYSLTDVDLDTKGLTVSGRSSNPSLVPDGNVTLGFVVGAALVRTVKVTPLPNQFGQTVITLTGSDGIATSEESFVLTVNPINDPPTIAQLPDQKIAEDSSTGAVPVTIGDIDTPVANLTLTASSTNPALVPVGNVVFGGSGASRTMTVTPLPDQTGDSGIVITVSDGASTAQARFSINVSPVNDPPTLSDVPDQFIDEDTSLSPVVFSLTDVDSSSTALTVRATSSNTALVPDGNITLGGSGASRTVAATPLAQQSGKTTITLIASDGSATREELFTLTVNAVNDPPTLSDIPDQKIDEDGKTAAIPFTVGDIDSPVANLVLTASSTNPTLVPDANVVFGGTGANRTVTVTPSANQSGQAVIVVTVSDGSATAVDRFTVDVVPSNDAPTISNLADIAISEDGSTGALPFTVGDAETAAGSLTVQASSSNAALVPGGNVVLGGSGANRTVTVTPLGDQSGTTVITVTVSDGVATASDTFTVTVNAQNDAPTISGIPDQSMDEDKTLTSLAFSIADVDTALTALSLRVTSSNPALVPDTGLGLGGSAASRTLSITPLPNQSGRTTITIILSDGVATVEEAFVLTVNAVNDGPTISDIPNQSVQSGFGTGSVAFTVGDPDTAVELLKLSATSSDTVLVPISAIVFSGTAASRSVNVTPVGTQGGSATITVTVSDGVLTASDTFVVTVAQGVEAPKIAAAPVSLTVNEGEPATFEVKATGTAPLRYQWQFKGQDLPDGTEPTYVLRSAQAAQEGIYTVRIGNAAATITSDPVTLTVVRLDYGDTPDGALAPAYPTLRAKDGARHIIVPGFSLGATVDSETDARVSADATGDDKGGSVPDDEDGVEFLTQPLTAGQSAQVRVTLTAASGSVGKLDAFIDFNGDGVWTVPGERIFAGQTLVPGVNTLNFTVPADTKPISTFARFRLSREGGLGPTGAAPNGEVEDYLVRTAAAPPVDTLDFGDAPEGVAGTAAFGYPTTLARNGARHVILPGFFLGKSVDAEADGQPNATATGDDQKPETLDDEDGVEFKTPLVAGKTAQIAVTASQTGRLDAWIDFNGNRSWADPGEQILVSTVVAAGVNNLNVQVPASAKDGVTFARFRLSRDGKQGFVGQARDGEVEDYQVAIESGAPCDVNYKGREFWLTFPGNYPQGPNTPLRLTLCIVGPQGITGTVSIPGLRYSKEFTLPASMMVDVVLPDAASLGDDVDVVQRKGVHVEASGPVAVYGLNRIPYSSDGYLGLPVEALGTEHIIAGYPNVFSSVSALNGTQFAVVATEDETLVTVIPSRNVLGHPKGEPYVVPLERGQTYQLRDPNDATADLTGTELISDKPIAVFSGHQCANIDSPGKMFCDHLVEQLMPLTAWSKVFYAIPLATRPAGDVLRVVGAQDNTKVFINGVDSGTVGRGKVRTFSLTSATRVDATRPVFVSQFARSSDADNVENADPFMVTVPPVRFYTKDHMICTGPANLTSHHVNIVAPSGVAGLLTLDGVVVPAAVFVPIGGGFSSARLPLTPGAHAISAPQAFGTIVYGFGPYEGYGWPGGMYFGDISPPVITCPDDFTVTTGLSAGTAVPSKCVALVPDLRQKVVVSDNCELPTQRVIQQTPEPGTALGPGKYVITLVAHDAAGNEAECQVTMTVVDPGPASIVCPKDFTVLCNKGAGAAVAFQVIARTECGTLVPVECTPASGALFPPGVTTVVCRIKDSPDQTCSFKVNVVCPPDGKNGQVIRRAPVLSWNGDAILETALRPDGPWTPVPEARSPFDPAALEGGQFFRLRTRSSASALHSVSTRPILVWK